MSEIETTGNPVLDEIVSQVKAEAEELTLSLKSGKTLKIKRVKNALLKGRMEKAALKFAEICMSRPAPSWKAYLPSELFEEDKDMLVGLGMIKQMLIPQATDVQVLKLINDPDTLVEIMTLIQAAVEVSANDGEVKEIEAVKND
jgi:hypothetical protein